ncbi:protein-L-isoaspartate O-methyltransferase [Halalkaliarchaeum sp. AArc-GB]|uniref:protein-L-isoaspartate O-methyltransferase family protein n=1 Tax=Halalkaliarchaeum sp. AArc-GB TaxID=3074078 RepID=UPI0028568BFF|nr:protein-L-isoaspartate O-methyltransferase [Halalkaliarchaeum sp. AArc-GB]MDR5674013.1 protein-L-isoaspartate O-methyltransferase [Halalkaliarchaeum sp. AArc-GB]
MDPAVLRDDMVEGLEYGLDEPLDPEVSWAMRTVPRHEFLDEAPYENRPTEAYGTRVLAPKTAAQFVDALAADEGDDVLVVGAGIGYTVAVIAEIVGDRHVHAVDIDRRVVSAARSNLESAGYGDALVDRRDGAEGLPEYAPYDRILLEAAVVRPPTALLDQLAPEGTIVFPRGMGSQQIVVGERDRSAPDGYRILEEYGLVQLGPLLAKGERHTGPARNRTVREDAEFQSQGYFARSGWEYDWVDWEDQL